MLPPRHGLCARDGRRRLTGRALVRHRRQFKGGGVNCRDYGMPEVAGCTISGSRAATGAAINCDRDAEARFTNCTIVANHAAGTRGARSPGFYNSPVPTNCILWAIAPDEVEGSHPWIYYCDVQGMARRGQHRSQSALRIVRRIRAAPRARISLHRHGRPELTDGISDWHPRWPEGVPNGPRSDVGAYGGPGNWGWLP